MAHWSLPLPGGRLLTPRSCERSISHRCPGIPRASIWKRKAASISLPSLGAIGDSCQLCLCTHGQRIQGCLCWSHVSKILRFNRKVVIISRALTRLMDGNDLVGLSKRVGVSEFDSVGARNIPERLRLTKAVLQSRHWMWFCLPLPVWVP